MKTITVIFFLTQLSFFVEAKSELSLNEAVNQVKSEGKVLSAKTINGRHEIKILTPDGMVKTVNKKAFKVGSESNRNQYNYQESQKVSNKGKENNRLQNSRNVMKLKEQNNRSRRNGKYRMDDSSRRKLVQARAKNKNTQTSNNKNNK